MEKLDSVIVTLVLKMREIVIFILSVKMVLLVDQTIVQFHLVLTQKLIVVIPMLKYAVQLSTLFLVFITYLMVLTHLVLDLSMK